jgi:hypothetical protein
MFNIRLQGLIATQAGSDGPKRDVLMEFNTIHNAGFADFNSGPAGGICLDSQRLERFTVRYNIIQKIRDFNIVLTPVVDRVANQIVLRENLIGEAFPDPKRLNTERWLQRMRATYGDLPRFGNAEFVDAANWDFRLKTTSPAVDATPNAKDPDGSAADFGAFANLVTMPPLPETGKGYVLRLITGSDKDYTDKQGRVWKTDRGVLRKGHHGAVDRKLSRIKGTQDPYIYSTELYGGRTVPFEVPPGRYKVRMHFAETWQKAVGRRVFNIYLNNQLMEKELDVFAEAGPATALVKEFEIAVPRGKLELKLENIKDNAIINGLEIIQITK